MRLMKMVWVLAVFSACFAPGLSFAEPASDGSIYRQDFEAIAPGELPDGWISHIQLSNGVPTGFAGAFDFDGGRVFHLNDGSAHIAVWSAADDILPEDNSWAVQFNFRLAGRRRYRADESGALFGLKLGGRRSGDFLPIVQLHNEGAREPVDIRAFGRIVGRDLPANVWHRVVIRRDGSDWYVYLNGELKSAVSGLESDFRGYAFGSFMDWRHMADGVYYDNFKIGRYTGPEPAVELTDAGLSMKGLGLSNRHIELSIDPFAGGRISSLTVTDGKGSEYVFWEGEVRPGGFSADIIPADKYPGPFRDASYSVSERDESGRRVVLTHRTGEPGYEGIRIDKEYEISEDGGFVSVRVTLTNEGDAERDLSLRAQSVIPRGAGVFTYPAREHVGAYDLTETLPEPGGWYLDDISGGWVAFASSEEEKGIVFLFEKEETERVFCWFITGSGNAVEFAYRERKLSPGESWSAEYRIVPTVSGLPVMTAGDGIVAGLLPLEIPLPGDAVMEISAYESPGDWNVKVDVSSSQTGAQEAEYSFRGTPLRPERIEFPWAGENLLDMAVTAESGEIKHAEFLHEQMRFVRVRAGIDYPDPTEFEHELADEVTSYFPFGGYLHAGHPGAADERGSQEEYWRRSIRQYRRNYMNTVTGYIQMRARTLEEFQRTGTDWYAEKLRKHDMRVIPRQETLRFRDSEGQWIFPENITREKAFEMWRDRQFQGKEFKEIKKLFRDYAEEYNDIILAYDISDEPPVRYVPWYVHMRDIFHEMLPERPATTILNSNRYEYIPHVPIFYADNYPIADATRGGRFPYRLTERTRRAVDEVGRGRPVWIMLQAFETAYWLLPDEGETRYMAYSVYAAGGKGITYHGVRSASRWLISRGYERVFMQRLGTWTPEWRVVGEVARHLTAIGPATMEYLPVEGTGVTVESETIQLGHTSGAAILAYVLGGEDGGGGFVIVVQNQDTGSGRSGRLIIPAGLREERVLYDLMDLERVKPAGRGEISLDINFDLPGDARIFYLGAEEEAAGVVSLVHKHHYLNERAIFNIDLELAENNNADARRARRVFNRAERAFGAGRYQPAHRDILAAREELGRIIQGTRHLGSAKADGEAARQFLSEVTELYGKHLDVIAPRELEQKAERFGQRLPTGTGIRPAEVDGMVEKTAELIRRINRAEDRLYLGGASEVADELLNIASEAEKHLSDVRMYFKN